MFTGSARINYLSTLSFDETFLEQVRTATDGVEVVQVSAHSVHDIDAKTWAQVDVLHTSSVLCDPSAAPRLKWVQLDTSGVDHVRGEALWQSNVPITTIGGVSSVPLAEFVIWSILGTAHRLPELLEVRDSHAWPSPAERWRRMLPAPVRGATVGIVGYGRIGREIGRMAGALGMKVIGLSRTAGRRTDAASRYFTSDHVAGHSPASTSDDAETVGPDSLHSLMERSDFLVVVVPLTDATKNLIDAEAFSHLKRGAAVINVARGGIVHEDSLRSGLRSGRISAAVLDVFEAEPLAPGDPWWTEPNVFVTPHVSGFAPEYSAQIGGIVRENMRRFGSGETLMNLVDRERGY